jgi:hypothetical protein
MPDPLASEGLWRPEISYIIEKQAQWIYIQRIVKGNLN